MADTKERSWVGDGKQVAGYPLINLNICLSDVPQDAVKTGKNGKKYLNLTVGERRNGADQFGNTHSIWVNDYKPEGGAPKAAPAKQEADLPF